VHAQPPLPPAGGPSAEIRFARARPPGRVLVIANDSLVRQALDVLVSIEGCETQSVATLQEALPLTRDWSPELVLLEINQSDPDVGAAVESLRHATAPSPYVALLTGYPFSQELAVMQGAVGYLPMPFDVDELLTLVDRYADCDEGVGAI
jgi:CheY-like chemotaxis protein